MTTITITDETVDVTLTRAEKVWALHGDLRIPRSQIRAVEALDEPLPAPRGLRAPGLALPGRVKLGTWRSPRSRQFVAVRRGVPGVRLHLTGNRYDHVVLSVEDESVRKDLLDLP
jgi:hypothetical protein